MATGVVLLSVEMLDYFSQFGGYLSVGQGVKAETPVALRGGRHIHTGGIIQPQQVLHGKYGKVCLARQYAYAQRECGLFSGYERELYPFAFKRGAQAGFEYSELVLVHFVEKSECGCVVVSTRVRHRVFVYICGKVRIVRLAVESKQHNLHTGVARALTELFHAVVHYAQIFCD